MKRYFNYFKSFDFILNSFCLFWFMLFATIAVICEIIFDNFVFKTLFVGYNGIYAVFYLFFFIYYVFNDLKQLK